MKKPLKILLYTALFLLAAGFILNRLFFSNQIVSSRFANVIDMVKLGVQGSVENHTPHPIKVTNYHTVEVIPPGQSSEAIGFHDVDAIFIQRPTEVEGKRYDHGVFKFCDFAAFRISEQQGVDVLEPSAGAFLCKFIHDYRYFETLRDSCPLNPFGNVKVD